MATWNGNMSTECVFCKKPEETRSHLFFECQFSQRIWSVLVGKIMGSDFTDKWDRIIELLTEGKSDDKFLVRYVFQSLIYMLWCERNNRRHGALALSGDSLIRLVDKGVRNKITVLQQDGRSKVDHLMRRWFETH